MNTVVLNTVVLNTVVLNTAVLNAVALNAAIQNSAMPNAVRWIGWRGTRSYSRELFPGAISESHFREPSPPFEPGNAHDGPG